MIRFVLGFLLEIPLIINLKPNSLYFRGRFGRAKSPFLLPQTMRPG